MALTKMNQNKRQGLYQAVFSMIGIVACLFIKSITILSKVIKWVLFLFLIILLFDGLKRLFKRIEPTTMGKVDEDE